MNSISSSKIIGVSLFLVLLSAPSTARSEGDVVRGKAVYETHCATCHGLDGRGNGPSARQLHPRPRNLADGTFKFRSTPSGSLPTDEDLVHSIRFGMAGSMMPAWKGLLTDQQLEDVTAYLKTFSDRFEKEKPGVRIVVAPEPSANEESVRRGGQLYIDLGCTACHGPKGRGNGPSSKTLRDQAGQPIRATDLTRRHLKSGPEGKDLYRTLMTGLDGAPMPSFAEQLTPEDAWAIVHYLQSLQQKRGFWKKLIVGE